jgi:hypothetical protein
MHVVLWFSASTVAHGQASIFDSGKENGHPVPATQTAPDAVDGNPGPLSAATQPAADAKVRLLKIPDAAAQRNAMKRVRDVFGTQMDGAKLPADKLKLAQQLLRAGMDEQADLDGRYVLLTLASDNGSSAGSFDTASQAIDELSRSHLVDAIELKANSASTAAKVIRSLQERVQFVANINIVIEQAVDEDRYEVAVQLGNLAVATARLSDDPNAIRNSAAQLTRVREMQSGYVEIKPAIDTLGHKPTDVDANLKVGRFLCLVKGDWQHGPPLLAIGGTSDIAKLASTELAGAGSTKDQIALGDGWWNLADKLPERQKLIVQRHAANWYHQALASVDKGLLRQKLEQRIQLCADDATPAKIQNAKTGDLIEWKFDNLSKFEQLKVVASWRRTPPKTTLGGQVVNSSLVITREKSPYLITGPIVVRSGATLTIESGAVLLVAPKVKIDVEGTLTAASEGPWIVLAASDASSNWAGIVSAGKIDLRRCLMTGAVDALEAGNGNVTVTDCIFANNTNTLGFGNSGHGKVQDSLFLHNSRGPLGHGDDGSVDFTRCLFLFNKVGCTANFYGKTKGDSSTFYGNDVAIEGSDRGDFIRVTLSNIITTSGKPLASRGGKAIVSGNYWGKAVPVDPAHDVGGPLTAPVKDAFPSLPQCEYLAVDGATNGVRPPVAER